MITQIASIKLFVAKCSVTITATFATHTDKINVEHALADAAVEKLMLYKKTGSKSAKADFRCLSDVLREGFKWD